MSGRGRALFLALLTALLWQSLVAGVHSHLTDGPVRGNPALVSNSTPDTPTPYDSPANCPVCRELATTGPAILPAPPVFAAPVLSSVYRTVAWLCPQSAETRSHLWQSRAPPEHLQA